MREYTKKLLNAMNDGTLDAECVAIMAINWLSEADVKEMCQSNDLFQNGDNDPYGTPDEDDEEA